MRDKEREQVSERVRESTNEHMCIHEHADKSDSRTP